MSGHGRQHGALRPDWGPGWADLACADCGATWTGPIGEECAYCARALVAMIAHQARLDLVPPDVDPADRDYRQAIVAWGHRLARAVRAGRITRRVAAAAYAREARRGI